MKGNTMSVSIVIVDMKVAGTCTMAVIGTEEEDAELRNSFGQKLS